MLLGHARCARLGALDGAMHGHGSGRRNGRGAERGRRGHAPRRDGGGAARAAPGGRRHPRAARGRGVTAPAASSFVRTVLGDVDPAELGVTYAHEHLVIAGGRPVEIAPDLRLDSVDDAVSELAPAVAVELRTV